MTGRAWVVAVLLVGHVVEAEMMATGTQDEAVWRRELLPLPQEISVRQVQRLQPGAVTIRGRAGAAGLERSAAAAVVELFRSKTGMPPTGAGFEIVIGLLDAANRLDGIDVPQAARLHAVPNRDQAYVVQPVGTDRLVVAALADRGLYYGTRTLSQWLESHLSPDLAEIPLASVVDWPDLEERGFWHMPVSLVPWLASMKMNRFFVIHHFAVDSAGIRPFATYNEIDEDLRKDWTPPYERARSYAAEVVPGPTHMDFWEARCPGYKEAFPRLIGQGEAAKDPFTFGRSFNQRVPCASHPDMVKILTAVLTELAAQKAAEVMVWMSEFPTAGCECEVCRKEGQFRAEARVTLAAWQEAKKTYPDLRVSLFFGRGGFLPPPDRRYPDAEIRDIVAALPAGVALRASMGCDGPDGRLLAEFAANGARIARCNIVALSSAFRSEDIRSRLAGIVAEKYIGAWQFTPGGYADSGSCRRLYNFRICALAEYAWNTDGRNAREFAEAWAGRQGFGDPAGFLAWIDAMNVPQAGRLEHCWPRDLYASWFGRLWHMVSEKRWDDSLFKPADIEPGIRKAEQALALAEKLGDRDLIRASRQLLAYCRLEQAGHQYISGLQAADPAAAAQTQAGAERLNLFRTVLRDYVQARLDVASGFMAGHVLDTMTKQGLELEAELDKAHLPQPPPGPLP
jgi:hypothetical protein